MERVTPPGYYPKGTSGGNLFLRLMSFCPS